MSWVNNYWGVIRHLYWWPPLHHIDLIGNRTAPESYPSLVLQVEQIFLDSLSFLKVKPLNYHYNGNDMTLC